jgi:cytoskeletal protein RodZ
MILKIILLVSFTLTVGVVWFFVSYTNYNNNSTSEIVYVQSSSVSRSNSSKAISSSSIISSSSSIISSSSDSSSNTSSESSSISSLQYPILDNNLDLINVINLIIDKPNSKIQEQIKSAKSRPKAETKISETQLISSTQESISSVTEKP